MLDLNSTALDITKALIQIPSITPNDKGCQTIIADYVKQLDFEIHHYPHSKKNVDNLFAKYGNQGPLFLFLGHTDVVPPGPLDQWDAPPFEPTLKNNSLYGRGTQDMKSSIAAMLIAIKEFIKHSPSFYGQIGLLITSAEEGEDYLAGVPYALQQMTNNPITWCLVGEPSCSKQLGDTIRIGRRGSLKFYLTIKGKQGHVAYPEQIENPITSASNIINEIKAESWCSGNAHFPPTSLECVHIACDNKTTNITPHSSTLWFAIRYSNELTESIIKEKIIRIINKHSSDYKLRWEHSGHPFLTKEGELLNATRQAIKKITDHNPIESTGGGTSDGRFIAPLGVEVVEFGTCNNSIHKINEHVSLKELDTLPQIYYEILNQLFKM